MDIILKIVRSFAKEKVLEQSFRHSSVQVRADLNYSESRQTHDAQAAPTPLRQNPGGCHVAIPGLLRHVEPICYAREHNEPRGQRGSMATRSGHPPRGSRESSKATPGAFRGSGKRVSLDAPGEKFL
jgi:hypothetical protein